MPTKKKTKKIPPPTTAKKTVDTPPAEPPKEEAKTIAELAAESTTHTSTKKGSSAKPLIEISGVEKKYVVGKNVIHVLKGINIQIYPQEFIVLLGPSGSGKSTILNTLLGLEPPTTGHVVVEGVDFTTKKPDQIAKLRYKSFGIVFQRPEWVRSLTVQQNVEMPLALNRVGKGERSQKAVEKLKIIGMHDHADYFPTELSGGQQQKVTIARALVNEPHIIVADEPTGNLDSKSAEKVMDMLKEFNEKEKKTIILVTHNLDYVRYASRTIYIRDGHIIQGSEQFLQS